MYRTSRSMEGSNIMEKKRMKYPDGAAFVS
jgi:hypothetical protein